MSSTDQKTTTKKKTQQQLCPDSEKLDINLVLKYKDRIGQK